MTSPYLDPESIERNRLEIRSAIRRSIIVILGKWAAELEKKNVSGLEIIRNLALYCCIYMSRCKQCVETEDEMKMVEDFAIRMAKRYPWGTNGRLRLVEEMMCAVHWLLDPEMDKVTEAGKNLGKS